MTRMFLLFTFYFCLFTSALAQTSRFERPFFNTNGTLATGKVIYIVNETTSDSLLLTEHPTKPGLYYRDNVGYGNFKVYVDDVLTTQQIWVGASRIRTFIETVDPNADNTVDSVGIAPNAVLTSKIKDSTIVKADLDTTLLTWIKTQAGGGGGTGPGYPPDYVTIELTLPDSELTIADGGVTYEKIADNAVITDKINSSAVTTVKINDGAVTNVKLANSSFNLQADSGLAGGGTTYLGTSVPLSVNTDSTTVHVLDDTVRVMDLGIGNAQLANGAVTSGKLATESVSTAALIDSVVTFQKLASEVEDSILAHSPGNIGSQISDSLTNYFPVNTANILDETIKASDIDPNYLYGLQRIDDDVWGVYPDDVTIEVSSNKLSVKNVDVEVINNEKRRFIKDFGAALDETTLNDAVDWATANEGVIVINDTTTLTDSVIIKSNITIEGEGAANRIIIDSLSFLTKTAFSWPGNLTNVTFRNIIFDCDGATGLIFDNPLAASTDSVTNILFDNCEFINLSSTIDISRYYADDIVFRDCKFKNLIYNQYAWPDSLPAAGSVRIRINLNNITFTNCFFGGFGLKIEGDGENVRLENCDFRDIGYTAVFIRTDDDTLKHINIENCTWDYVQKYNATKGAIGIGTSQNITTSQILDAKINNCSFYGTEIGILLDGETDSSEVKDLIISNCIFDGKPTKYDTTVGFYGIISGSGKGSENIKIQNCYIKNYLSQGISLSTYRDIEIINCTIDRTAQRFEDFGSSDYYNFAGILIASGEDNIKIANNTIKNIGTPAAVSNSFYPSGIVFWKAAAVDSVNIINNTFIENRATKSMQFAIDLGSNLATNKYHTQIIAENNQFFNMDSADIMMRETNDGDNDEVKTWLFQNNTTDQDTVILDEIYYSVYRAKNQYMHIKDSTGLGWNGVLSLAGATTINQGVRQSGLTIVTSEDYQIKATLNITYLAVSTSFRLRFYDGASYLYDSTLTTTGLHQIDTTVTSGTSGSGGFFYMYRTSGTVYHLLADSCFVIRTSIPDTITANGYFNSDISGWTILNSADAEWLANDNITFANMPSAYNKNEYYFINPDTSWTLKLTPKSGEQFRGYAANAKLDVDNFAWVKCIRDGIWEIMSLR